LPTATSICSGGVPLAPVAVKLGGLGGASGDETFVVTGALVPPAGTTLDPAARGMQVLVEDLGPPARPLLDLTAASGPIPPGTRGGGCDPADGWKGLSYRNRSGAIDPPACTAGSAHGLRKVRLKDRRAKGHGIVFQISGRRAALAAPVGALRVTIVLAADPAAGAAGECGTHAFAAADCKRKRASLRCR
jgi:hypothetical protein